MKKAILNEILALQKKLKPFTKAQIEYAHSHYERVAYLKRGGEIWCQCCGHIYRQLPGVIDIDLELGGQCPECGAHFNLDRRRGKHHTEGSYITYITHVAGWQVFRTVLAQRCNTYGSLTHYYMDEVYQNWVAPDGKEYILSKGYTRSPLMGEKWAYDTPLNKPREHNANYTGCYVLNDMFDVTGNYIYPRVFVTAKLKRNGWDNRFLQPNISPAEVCKALLSFPALEMLAKTQREQQCSDQCTLSRENITDKQALRVLHYAQKWRRGAKTDCVNPYVFGIAIDRAIRALRKEVKNESKNKENRRNP